LYYHNITAFTGARDRQASTKVKTIKCMIAVSKKSKKINEKTRFLLSVEAADDK